MRIVQTESGESFEGVVEKENLNLDDQSTYFLLPDIPAIVQAENLFLKGNGLWGDRLLTFGKLSFISNLNSSERRNVISRMGRLFMMEEIVDELNARFSYFKDKFLVKGFSESLLKIIAELKHAKITPQDLVDISEKEAEGDLKDKLKDLAQIFKSYQDRLEREILIDDIDKLKLLSESTLKGRLSLILPGAKKIVVFGFYDFTPSQLEVLVAIDKAGFDLVIYIPSLDEVAKFKSVVTGKFENWLGGIEIERMVKTSRNGCEIEIHSFPSLRDELEFCATEIKGLLLKGGYRPGEIGIVSRTMVNKEGLYAGELDRLGIPYSISTSARLGASALGQFTLTLLRVKSSGFEKKHFLNLIRNPFLGAYFKHQQIYDFVCHIDFKSSKKRTIRGAKAWDELLSEVSENEDFGIVERVKNLISIISRKLNSLDVGVLTEDLANVMDELLVYESLRGSPDNKDSLFNSWSRFHSFTKELRYLSKFRFKAMKVGALNEFIDLLQELWIEEKFSHSSAESAERVQILNALETRGTTFQILFVLDVAERSFPLPFIRDPILKNDERAHINDYMGNRSLYEEFYHYESEDLLFNLIKSSTGKKLYISYSYSDEKDRSNLPSYLVYQLETKMGTKAKKHLLEDKFKSYKNVYTKSNLAEHLFYLYSKHNFEFQNYSDNLPESIKYVLRGINAEARRLVINGVYSEFEGKIENAELLPDLNEFSPTKLETYGQCPFRFFASNILNLKKADEIEDDVNALDLGLFYHRILRELFLGLSKENEGRVDVREKSYEEISEALQALLKERDFNKEFSWLSEGRRALTIKRITEQVLPQFIQYELIRIKEWNQSGFFPARFEKGVDFEIDDIKLSGIVDRIDVGDRGLLIIDYKLRPSSVRKFLDFRNLQLPLYLYAFSKLGEKPVGGFFRFLERPDSEIGFQENGKKSLEDQLSYAERQVRIYVSLMRKGFFPPVIDEKGLGFEKMEVELRKDDRGPCGWCEYSDLCRAQGGVFRRL
ncbi:MAG: PD-(D/E)XK nuclease family protein [Thermodesulfobacteriota bacterium]